MRERRSPESLICEVTMFAGCPKQRLQHALRLANSAVGSTKKYWLKQAEEIREEIDSNDLQQTKG